MTLEASVYSEQSLLNLDCPTFAAFEARCVHVYESQTSNA